MNELEVYLIKNAEGEKGDSDVFIPPPKGEYENSWNRYDTVAALGGAGIAALLGYLLTNNWRGAVGGSMIGALVTVLGRRAGWDSGYTKQFTDWTTKKVNDWYADFKSNKKKNDNSTDTSSQKTTTTPGTTSSNPSSQKTPTTPGTPPPNLSLQKTPKASEATATAIKNWAPYMTRSSYDLMKPSYYDQLFGPSDNFNISS